MVGRVFHCTRSRQVAQVKGHTIRTSVSCQDRTHVSLASHDSRSKNTFIVVKAAINTDLYNVSTECQVFLCDVV